MAPKINPRDLVMPAAAFTMAITVVLYTKSTMRRAKYQAELERERQLELFNRPANTSDTQKDLVIMVKITQKIAQAERDNRVWWSFEYFPPRTAQGLQNLYDRIERMRLLGPEFIDITWNAGGRTSDLTCELVKTCQGLIGMETCMHLTCTNMPKEKVDMALQEAKLSGCRNILALRGDPPAGQDEWSAVEGGFVHGIDLIRHIRAKYDDYFEIAIAGFPQHIDLPAEELAAEMKWLKEKVDAGATLIFTQMFYDVEIFLRWVAA
ncbi:hypothetical protein FRC00_014229, partial [Tulasnella sp. 408]